MPDAWSLDYIRSHWRKLEAESTDHSIFQSWDWIECWLETAKKFVRPVLFKNDSNKVVGICFVGFSKSYDYKFFGFHTIYPFLTGKLAIDVISSEYNAVLFLPEYRHIVHETLIDFLLNNKKTSKYSRILLQRVPCKYLENYKKIADENDCCFDLYKTEPSAAVDLQHLRDDNLECNHYFSKSLRYTIRRSTKEYEKQFGSIQFERADNVTQAQNWFQELGKLNQIRFQSKNQKSAWDYPNLVQMNRVFINRQFSSGNVEIVRLRAGTTTIGYLYNFVYRGVVYFYMSGIRYEKSNLFAPGLMIHEHTIYDHFNNKNTIYDFMAGDQSYKYRLGKHSLDMHHFTITKKGFMLKCVHLLSCLKKIFKKRVL
ncbi:MAG: hypothetical protein ACJARD_001082 [Alphaproteobacteria bacterium]|jgi:hypothetical protein